MAGTLRFLMALGSAHASSGSRQSPLTEKFLLERIASPHWLQCQFSRDWGELGATLRPGQTRLGQIEIALDAPQRVIIDHAFIS